MFLEFSETGYQTARVELGHTEITWPPRPGSVRGTEAAGCVLDPFSAFVISF